MKPINWWAVIGTVAFFILAWFFTIETAYFGSVTCSILFLIFFLMIKKEGET